MSDTESRTTAAPPGARTVQDYIDMTPMWPDGTPTGSAPMTKMQSLIWSLAAAGKFFEGLVVFMTGIALPLIARQFHITAGQDGIVSAATLAGILIGAVGLGGLSDAFGRKLMFVVEMVIFTVFLAIITVVTGFWPLVLCLFAIGVALGCDYPTAHMIISESTPSARRGQLVLGAFAFQAVGALVGTGVGYLVLQRDPALDAWHWMFATALIPAIIVTVWRFFITESAPWLFARGHHQRAEAAAVRLLKRRPQYPKDIALVRAAAGRNVESEKANFAALFNVRNRRATILASVPWFLQDLSTYGIGIFTPTILAAAFGGPDHFRSTADIITKDIIAAKGSALITSMLLVGITFAVLLADRLGRIKLQVFGFVGCAVGLLVASCAAYAAGSLKIFLIFAGVMLFNFMTDLGPNAQTYLLAGEVFPTAIRGSGAGFAAAFAKIGAVLTAFLFPILLKAIGQQTLLLILVGTSILGAAVTWWYRIETNGVNLDTIGETLLPDERAVTAVPAPS
ncbi:MAG: MFS transporter [Candidatus Velthaea sp.]|jgi:MFS family permease